VKLVWTVSLSLVFAGVALCEDWQEYKRSMQEGNLAAQGILSEIGSPQQIENRISSPIANPDKSFTTFGPDEEKQEFRAAVFENTNTYNLNVHAPRAEDGTFSGVTATTQPPNGQKTTFVFDNRISGICYDGFITGTTEYEYYTWQVSKTMKITAVNSDVPLKDCICITYSCGLGTGTDLPLLERLSAGVVTAVHRALPTFAVVKADASPAGVTYVFSQISSYTDDVPEFNPQDDSGLEDQIQYERYRARQDDNSVYSILSDTHQATDYNSQQMKSDTQRANRTAWSAKLDGDGFSYQAQTSDGQWGVQKYALPLMPQAQGCEKVCKISRCVTDTAMTKSGPVSELRRDGAASKETVFRMCQKNVCPAVPGETIVTECACKSDFKEIAAAMQMFDAAGKDTICSKK
jgi:hypothetical protein